MFYSLIDIIWNRRIAECMSSRCVFQRRHCQTRLRQLATAHVGAATGRRLHDVLVPFFDPWSGMIWDQGRSRKFVLRGKRFCGRYKTSIVIVE